MRSITVIIFLLFITQASIAQNDSHELKAGQKGKLYFYWGWNRGWYSNSDISFSGDNYNFTLKEVVAKDRQTSFAIDPYLNPAMFTIPQYNFRVGYYIKNNWNISFGIDHMKYVVEQYQTVSISGYIDDPSTEYSSDYSDDDIVLSDDFLQFEHTDGLNYINVELRREDRLFDFKKIDINLTEGFGIGALVPKTNTALLGKERYDEFHLTGYGLGIMAGINVTFFDFLFVQTEFKGGYINMPDIRTTKSESDKASQHFFYTQFNLVFGATINLKKDQSKKKNQS